MSANCIRDDRALRGAKPRRWPLALALISAIAAVHADVVTDWNAIATSPLVLPQLGRLPAQATNAGPQQQTRAMAIVQIAVHDALNSIDPRYETYSVVPPAPVGATPDAAVATAAWRTLSKILESVPVGTAKDAAINHINSQYAAALAAIPNGTAKTQGITAGEAAANAILDQRYGYVAALYIPTDGAATPHSPPYLLVAAPGVHQATPFHTGPSPTTPLFTGWSNVTPFALQSAAQFRAPPGEIFDLASVRYAVEYNQVKRMGDARVRGALPDSGPTRIARFWPGGGFEFNTSMRNIATGLGLDRWQHARMFALANVSNNDALIANLESKYFYSFWRPVTAIRWADDGNAHTDSDPSWWPFLFTPPYPDYPCAGPTNIAANTGALRLYFGTDNVAFSRSVNAPAAPLPPPLAPLPAEIITRQYDTLSQVEDEVARARVYAGIHFMEGCLAGVHMGNQVAGFVFANYFRPVN